MRLSRSVILAVPLLATLLSASVVAEDHYDSLITALKWKEIGPDLGGRSIAVAGSVQRPNEYYFGATGGGLWKTTSGGIEWRPLTDGMINSASVGAVAVCEANPDIVYIGTGEGQFRGSMSMGDGVYRSDDAGASWRHLGLASDTGQQAVARVRVHPQNCDIAFAALMGDPWGPNDVRGVYKTSDGGKNWQQVLYRDEKTGATDLWIDANNPQVVYAALWQMRRRPWEANSGGPGSGLFKSQDGGETWLELTDRLNLGEGRIGKLGVSVSRADSQRIYVVVEHDAGGVFRSDDGGSSWIQVSTERRLIDRAEYYIRIYADPVLADRVYVLVGSGFYRSDDGGESYKDVETPHVDNHDVWIDPNNSKRMVQSNDGGANVSIDGGKTWTEQDMPTAQIYKIETSNTFPYDVCGSQQDRTSICMPIDGKGQAYRSAAGEQGWIAIDPADSNVHYGTAQRGWMRRLDRRTGQKKAIDIWPDSMQGLPPNQLRERTNWTAPVIASPHHPATIFAATQHVWRSDDRGDSWDRISPDLTFADPDKLHGEQSVIPNQNSQDYYATIYALALSPHEADTIWAGSDDGRVHMTRDGGQNWNDVTPPALPKDSRVNSIFISPHAPEKVFVSAERYKMQDLGAYIYSTRDNGRSWQEITHKLAAGDYARAIIEDAQRPGLLFLGTEHRPYVSFDDGVNWQPLQLNLPDIQVRDLEIREDTLLIATYGRGIWRIDDISLLRQYTAEVFEKPVHLFTPTDVIRSSHRRQFRLHYHLGHDAGSVSISILNKAGALIREYSGDEVSAAAGLAKFNWNLRYPSVAEFDGLRLRGGSVKGPTAPSGNYIVRLSVDGTRYEAPFRILKHPGLTDVSDEDLYAQFELAMRIHKKLGAAIDGVIKINSLQKQVDERIEQLTDATGNAQENLLPLQALKQAADQLKVIKRVLYDDRNRSPSGALQYGVKLVNKLAILQHRTVESADGRPTRQAYEVFDELSVQVDAQLRIVEQWD